MLNQYGWKLLQTPLQFSITENVTELSLANLPPQARKAKLYVCLQCGNCQEEATVTWSLSTKVDIIKITGHTYTQNAWSTNSENCPIRLDDRKIIEISRSGNFPSSSNFSLKVEVLGYK